jgi:hypothetical protein
VAFNGSLAWREILMRIMDGFPAEEGVSPEWLVNPGTRRRLKLDYYYPDARLAVRFEGAMGKRKGPISDQEMDEVKGRGRAREELCDANGVCLVCIDLTQLEPQSVLREISAALSRSIRYATDGGGERKVVALVERLTEARSRSDSLQFRVRTEADLALYADLYRDRLYAQPKPAERPQAAGPAPRLSEGARVEHDRFGLGTVTAIDPDGQDSFVSVRFDDGSERRFAASLLAGRMKRVASRRAKDR